MLEHNSYGNAMNQSQVTFIIPCEKRHYIQSISSPVTVLST